MTRYALRRLALALPLALGVATLVFVLIETAPGDPADLLLGDRPISPEVRERLVRAYGFDLPPHRRYLRWLEALFLRGELGWSHARARPVAAVLADALPPTLLLSATALALHLFVGVLLGVVSAARPGRWWDRSISLVSLTVYAMPTFWLGLMAVLVLGALVPIFPPSSMSSVGAENWSAPRRALDLAWHLALPATVLGVASAAGLARFVRAGMIEILARPFVRAARARGADRRRVLLRHGLRNCLLPIVNLIGLSLPALLSGSLVIEVVFAWPGMGRLTYESIRSHDLPVVLAATLLATLLVVVGSLAADLAMAAVDPRIRLGGEGRR